MSDTLKPSPRYVVVSDLPEWTVWDQVLSCDLFPTKSGNRNKACQRCDENTAHMIADALNRRAATAYAAAAATTAYAAYAADAADAMKQRIIEHGVELVREQDGKEKR